MRKRENDRLGNMPSRVLGFRGEGGAGFKTHEDRDRYVDRTSTP